MTAGSKSLGTVVVNIGANVKELETGIDSARKSLKHIEDRAKSAVAPFAKLTATATAAGAGIYAITAKASATGKEIKNLAAVANESVQSFQKQAFAANSVGIPMEKYADILKDTNDRIGDMVKTGGGPMVDFFEKVAPKVGVTVEQFRNLSGGEALGLYIQSLEKANLNQQDMTFFMEALASDATALIPLFSDNAAKLNAMTKEAEDLGLIISDLDIERLATQAPFAKLHQTLRITTTLIGNELLPYVTALANKFFDAAKEAGGVGNLTQQAMNRAAQWIGKGADAVHVLTFGFKSLQLGATIAGAVITEIFSRMSNTVRKVMEFLRIDTSGNAFFNGVEDAASRAWEQVDTVKMGLDDIAMKEYPSDKIAAFSQSIQEEMDAATRSAKETGNAILNVGGPDDGVITGFSPLDKIKEQFLMEETLEREHLERMALIGSEFDAKKFDSEEQWRQVSRDAENQYYADRMAMINEHETGVLNIIRSKFGAQYQMAAQSFGQMFQSFGQHSKKMAKIAEKFAIIDAGISMGQGIAAGLRLGWPMSVPAVAYATFNGLKAISQIKAAASGAGSSSGGGSVAPSASAGALSTGGGGGGPTGSATNQTLTIPTLDPTAIVAGADFNVMAQMMRDFVKDGGEIVVA